MKATLNINEAAKHAHVSRRTIYYWIAKGYVRTTTGPGRGWRIVTEDLDGMEKHKGKRDAESVS